MTGKRQPTRGFYFVAVVVLIPTVAALVLAAVGSSLSLALLAFPLVAQVPGVSSRGRWSDATLRHYDPVARPIGMLAAGVGMEWFGRERPAIESEEQNGRRRLARAA